MNELVEVRWNEAFTDSLVIAEGTGNQHKSIIRLIQKQHTRLERFGVLRFSDLKSTNPKGGRPTKVCYLNEQQATLLITFLDNTDKVADFKTELVSQFYKMKHLLMERATITWLETRQQSKLTRKAETDVIKKFVEYAKEQGSGNADKYYITFSRLANKTANITDRDMATTFQLNSLTFIESIILHTIECQLMLGTEYHEIYQKCKKAIDEFKDLTDYERLAIEGKK